MNDVVPSETVENYLKQLYFVQQQTAERLVPMGQLATAMDVAPGTVTSMVKALHESGLVEYEPRGGVCLTKNGRTLALRVVRRHRLVELFLVESLGLDWSEVHEEAEKLEHVISEKVLERLDEHLGHPSVDPHGDPIPGPKGEVASTPRVSLVDCEMKVPIRVTRVLDQDPMFLQFVEEAGLTPGSGAVVERRDATADAVTVRPEGAGVVTLGTAAAVKILVEAV